MDMIWDLNTGPLTTRSIVDVLIEEIEAVPGFEPKAYDLNDRGAHKPYYREHLIVDTLTQRTQLVRVDSYATGDFAIIATGKHGEEPVMMMRWHPDAESLVGLSERFSVLFERLSLGRVLITNWPQTLESTKGQIDFMVAYPHARIAPILDDLEELAKSSSIRLDRESNHMGVIVYVGADVDALNDVLSRI